MALFKPNIKKLKKEKDIEKLIMALSYEKDDDIVVEAAQALGELKDKRAIEPLVKILNDEEIDYYARIGAAKSLGHIKDKRATEPLIKALEENRGDEIRYTIVEALGKIKDPSATAPIFTALKEFDRFIYKEMIERGVDIKDTDAINRYNLTGSGGYTEFKNVAIKALIKIGKKDIEPIIAGLENYNNYIRFRAAEILGIIKDKRAADSLIAALKDQDVLVRDNVAEAFGLRSTIKQASS